jgi:hypothetical protein
MMGMPNGLCVCWAMDSSMVAEEDGSTLHPSPPSHECHCPVGSTSVGPSMSKQEVCEGKSLEGAPSHCVRVCQVMDARHP